MERISGRHVILSVAKNLADVRGIEILRCAHDDMTRSGYLLAIHYLWTSPLRRTDLTRYRTLSLSGRSKIEGTSNAPAPMHFFVAFPVYFGVRVCVDHRFAAAVADCIMP